MNTHATIYHIILITIFCLSTIPSRAVNQQCDSLLHVAIEIATEQEYFRSMELLTQARELAEESKDYETLFWILNNIGINHERREVNENYRSNQ